MEVSKNGSTFEITGIDDAVLAARFLRQNGFTIIDKLEDEMQPKPKYQAGDRVRVNCPGDSDHGKTFVVEGLSPSTQKKRARYTREWRYGLIGSEGYFKESELTKV